MVLSVSVQAQGEFTKRIYADGFDQAIGILFDDNGRMYVWEKSGKVWIVENGTKSSTPFLDISDEVGNWRDFGLLSVALDPNFLANGYVYLYYLVDRHHLINAGTPNYNPGLNDYFSASQGRVTRYQASAANGFTEVDYSTRKVLLGEEIGTGVPSLHESHLGGSLIFGEDETLLLTTGDAGSYLSIDQGSAFETYYLQALQDGIIGQDENIGSYRCQVLFSLNGKLLRIDPETGLGVPSNPYYDPANPDANISKVWGRGLRNPYRMSRRPGTGSHNPEDADPGSFYIGDVGAGTWEEINVANAPDQNFGWPRFEGMDFEPGFQNDTYFPQDHSRPKLDWRLPNPRASIDNEIILIGQESQVKGSTFQGNCSMGGTWYMGTDFPEIYQGTYFFSDYGAQWIKSAVFDENDNPVEIRNIMEDVGTITYLETSPTEGGMYFVTNESVIWKIGFENILSKPPVAVALADTLFGNNELTVAFQGDKSFDPEFFPVTYRWDFGDGSLPVFEANPTHTFTTSETDPLSYVVKLFVWDREGNIDSTSLEVSLNNNPPQILSTSLDTISTYTLQSPKELVLEANISDAEDDVMDLEVSWQVVLFHNDHFHPEPLEKVFSTVTFLSPVGCEDDATYWYRVHLKVKDTDGLTTSFQKDIFPDCGRTDQEITFENVPDLTLDQETFTLSATTTSGLPVTFFVVDGPASVTGETLTLNGTPGEVMVRATQPGNDEYNPALAIERTFTVFPGPPELIITAPDVSNTLLGSDITIRYNIFGNLAGANADHIHVILDDGPRVAWHELNGRYVLRDLPPGDHTVEIEIVTQDDQPLDNPQSKASISFSNLPGATGTGLTGTYYQGLDFEEEVLTRLDAEVDFQWGGGSPDPAILADFFSVRWEGTLEAPLTGNYTLLTTSDDGVRLWINDELIINSWQNQPATVRQSTLFMEAGERVSVKMEYYENGGAAVARLQWEHPSITRQIIPSRYLYPFGTLSSQVINFSYLSDRVAEATTIPLEISTTSGLPASVSLDEGPAILNGTKLELNGAEGVISITATQAGNDVFSAAPAVTRTFEVKQTVDPVSLRLLQPVNQDTLVGPDIEVGIEVDGDLLTENITHLYLYVDNRPPITIYNFPELYTLTSLEAGRHIVRAVLVTEDHQEIEDSSTEVEFWIAQVGRDCIALRDAWQSQDIGNVGVAGQSCQFNDVFVISGSGEDIWQQQDGFQFAYQAFTGDAAIIARVTQLTNTDPWAKAGVMIRSSLEDNATNVFLALTAENNGIFQTRSFIGGATEASYFNEQTPYWLRLERRGDILIALTSEDGVFWRQAGVSYLPMPEEVYIGMAMTSHANNTLGTAAFEGVDVFELIDGGTANLNPPTMQLVERQMDKHVYVSWESTNPNEWGYLIERAQNGNGLYEIVHAAGQDDRFWVDTEANDDGEYDYRIRSFSENGLSPYSSEAGVEPQNILCDVINVTRFGATASASSELNEFVIASKALDGNVETYWESNFTDNSWIRLDLGAVYNICSIVTDWVEDSYPGDFSIRVSENGVTFSEARQVLGNVSEDNVIRFEGLKARYVSLEASRIVSNNYKLKEFKVYTPDKQLLFNEDQLWVYPNPMQEELQFSMRVEEPKVVIVQLLDLAGRKISTWVEQLNPGYNDLSYDIRQISGGYYLLKVRTREEQIYRKINIFE